MFCIGKTMPFAADAALRRCDLYMVDASVAEDQVFLTQIFGPTMRKFMEVENKGIVPIHYTLGRFYKPRGKKAAPHRLFVVLDPPEAKKRAGRPRKITSEPEQVDVRDTSLELRRRRAEVLRQANKTPRTVFVIYNTDEEENNGMARVFVMDQLFAYKMMAAAYGPCVHNSCPMPRQIEALFAVNSLWLAAPIRALHRIVKQHMPSFLIELLLAAGHLVALSKRHEYRAKRPAASTTTTKPGFWGGVFGSSLVPAGADTSHDCADMPEFGLDSAANSDSGTMTSAENSVVNGIAAQRSVAVAMSGDSRRTAMCVHEFYDRLQSPTALRQLAERAGRVVAVAEQLHNTISQQSFGINWTQVDLFYTFQLMAAECGDSGRVSRTGAEPQTLKEFRERSSPDLPRTLERLKQLTYVYIVDKDRRSEDRNFAIVARALWHSSKVYASVSELFDEVDFGNLLDMMQTRRSVRQRRHEMSLVACAGPTLHGDEARSALAEFMKRNVLVADEQCAARNRFDVVVRVALNDQQLLTPAASVTDMHINAAVTQTGAMRWERVTPMAVLSSIRNALPTARDGIDFNVVWTPLSYLYSDDERYRKANAALATGGDDIFVADDMFSDYAAAAASDESMAEDDQAYGNNYKRRSTKKRKHSEPAAEMVRVSLAEQSIYVAMTQHVWSVVAASRYSTLLLQRALFGVTPIPAIRNYNAPLAAPLVMEQLATSDDIDILCASLNAFAALVGASPSEWLPGTKRAELFARRAARLVVRYLHYIGAGKSHNSVASVLSSLARLEGADNRYMHGEAIDKTCKNFRRNRIDKRRPHFDLANTFNGLSVILNGAALPVLAASYSFGLLRQACADDARTHAHVERCIEESTDMSFRWSQLPAWYTQMITGMRVWAPYVPAAKRRTLEDGEVESSSSSSESVANEVEAEQKKEEEADEKAIYERAQRLSTGRNNNRQYTSHCACGGATNEECSTMMGSICQQAEDASSSASATSEPRCCLCSLDTLPVPARPVLRLRFMAGVCRWCQQRVAWCKPGPDTCADQFIEIGTPGRDVSVYDLLERVFDWAATTDKHVADVLNFIESLRFRLRQWASVTVKPLRNEYRKSSAVDVDLDRTVPLDERVAALQNVYMREPLRRTLAMAGSRTETEDDDDLAAENTGAYVRTRRQIASASYYAIALELLSLTRRSSFMKHYDTTDAYGDIETDTQAALIDIIAPMRTARQVTRYCRRARELEHTFPLCPSAFAESTAHGAVALGTMSSNMTLPLHERVQHLLYDNRTVRPLASAVPLLQELLMMRWYTNTGRGGGRHVDDDNDNDDDETEEERALRSRGK